MNALIPFLALSIPVFSLFRLAKFNIDKRQSESFIGLPTPAMTVFFLTFPLILCYQLPASAWGVKVASIAMHPLFLIAYIVLFSVLMVSEIPLFSLKFKTVKWKGNQRRYVFLLISLLLIVVFRAWSFALIVFLYLTLSMIENSQKRRKNEIQS